MSVTENPSITAQIRAAANIVARESDRSADVIFAAVVSDLRHMREQDITTDLIAATAISHGA